MANGDTVRKEFEIMQREQSQNRDPFQIARQKAGVRSSAQPEGNNTEVPLPEGGFLSPTEQGNIVSKDLASQGRSETDTSASLLRTMGTATEPQRKAFEGSRLPSLLNELGIASAGQGLAFSEIGRFQLMSRLKESLGDQFMQDPRVKQILTEFDRRLRQDPTKQRSDTVKRLSTAQRTLDFLLKRSRDDS